AHRPVDHPDIRHVVARAVLLALLLLQLIEALNLAVEGAGGHVGKDSWDGDREAGCLITRREAADLEERKAAGLAGVPLRLRGRDLHALRTGHGFPEAVADHQLEQCDREGNDQRQLRRAPEDFDIPATEKVPATD